MTDQQTAMTAEEMNMITSMDKTNNELNKFKVELEEFHTRATTAHASLGEDLLADLGRLYQEFSPYELWTLSMKLFRARMTNQRLSREGCSFEWFQSEVYRHSWMWVHRNFSCEMMRSTIKLLYKQGGFAAENSVSLIITMEQREADTTNLIQATSKENV